MSVTVPTMFFKRQIQAFAMTHDQREHRRYDFIFDALGPCCGAWMVGVLCQVLFASAFAGEIKVVGDQGAASAGNATNSQVGAAGVAGSGGTGGSGGQSPGGSGANGVINAGTPVIGNGPTATVSPSTLSILIDGGTSTTSVTADAFALGGGGSGGRGGSLNGLGNAGTAGTYTLSTGANWTVNGTSAPINPTNLTVGGGGGGGGAGFGNGNGSYGGAGGAGTFNVLLGAQLATNGALIGGNGGSGGNKGTAGTGRGGQGGGGGVGVMSVSGAATWTATDIQVGGQGGSEGSSATSSTLGGGGNGGNGTLNILGTSTSVTLSGALTIGGTAGSGTFGGAGGSGTVNLQDGAALNSSGAITLTSTGMLNIGGDTAKAGTAGTIGGSGTSIVSEGIIRFNQTNSFTLSRVITGGGALTQVGGGTTTLSGANSYSGTTTVSGGALQVGNGGSGTTGTGALTVQSGGTILGSGVIQGSSFTALSGSTVHAGDSTAEGSYGTLTFTPVSGSGSFEFQSGSSVILGLNPGGPSDKLVFFGTGSNTLLFDSNLKIGPDTMTPVAPGIFDLLDWLALASGPAFGSQFSTDLLRDGSADDGSAWDLPDISGSGYLWDLSQFTA
ncbi:MAG: hypothetical protein KDK97_07345, partial [Verrucomicrobiales bacterium]|nr:hypothetical protein [Verrucomicrobiales bacterium]